VNFLAHCLIGARARDAEDPGLIAGGFLGDFIKGPIPSRLPDSLQLGVRLHRRVDAYSNLHPGIRRSADRFPAELRRIAPVLVDILCDHLLARQWTDFHPAPIRSFTATTYALVADHGEWLPEAGHRFLSYAEEKDLLAAYDEWPVAERAMRSITRRLGMTHLDPVMTSAVPPLIEDLAEDFDDYFPDIVDHAATWVADADRS
jgi:acyl carrier protein phosphodiesterase